LTILFLCRELSTNLAERIAFYAFDPASFRSRASAAAHRCRQRSTEMPRTAAACTLIAWLLLALPCKQPLYSWIQPGSSDHLSKNLLGTRTQGCRRRRLRSERTSARCWTAAATATASGPRGAGGRARRTASPTAAASTGSPTCCPSASACARGAPPPEEERPAMPRSDPSRSSTVLHYSSYKYMLDKHARLLMGK